MITGKKVLIACLACAAAVVLLLITIALLAPLVIDQKVIKEKIVRELSSSLNATVQIERAGFALLPRPCAAVRGVSIGFTGGISAKIKKTVLYPALLPLLRGNIQPARISLESPEVNIPLAKEETSAPVPAPSIAALRQQAVSAISTLVRQLPPCSFRLAAGTVHVSAPARALFTFSNISAAVDVSADRATVSAECASTISKTLTLQASTGISSPGIDGSLSFSGLDVNPVIASFFSGTLPIGSSAISGNLTFSADAAGTMRARCAGDIKQLVLTGPAAQQVIRGMVKNISITADAAATSVAFAGQFDHPRLQAEGIAAIDSTSGSITLTADGKNIDLVSLRDVLGAAAGSQPLVHELQARLKSGSISEFSFSARGPLGSSLLESTDTTLQAAFTGVRLLVPEAGLSLQEVGGELSMRNRMLEVKNLQAVWENSWAWGATLQLDAGRQYTPVLIDTQFSCDLSRLPALVRFIPAPDLKNELSLITASRGTAAGRLTIREARSAYTTNVSITSLSLQADYRKFPAPLELHQGTCTYRDGSLTFSEFGGRLGRSEIAAVSAGFSLGHDPHCTISARGAKLFFEDLLPVLNSFAATEKLVHDISAAQGSIALTSLDVKGPLFKPEQWTFSLRGDVTRTTVAASVLHGPLTIHNAALRADQRELALTECRAALLDSTLAGSVTLEGYLQGLQKLRCAARGSLGRKSLETLAPYISYPKQLMPRAPLSIASSQLAWDRAGATEFNGDFSCRTGPKGSLQLRADPQALEITKLKISGKAAESTLRLSIKEDEVDVSYAGSLDRETVDLLLADNQFVRGWIKGDIAAHLDQKNPLQSTASGTLSWKDVQVPEIENLPMQIQSASVAAAGNSLEVKALDAAVGKCELHAGGSVKFSQRGYVADMQVASDRIHLDALEKTLANSTAHGNAEEFWETPLRGRIRLVARSLSKAGLTWEPFNADITFSDRTVTVAAIDATLCEMATPGTLVATPDSMTLEVRPAAQKASVRNVVKCLTGEKSIITGALDVRSDLTARGPAATLADNLAGNISLAARKGHIYRSNLLTRILSFLSIRNLVTGGTTDIARKGFAYKSITVKGAISRGTFRIDEGILDSNTLSLVWQGTIDLAAKKMDLTVLATPFQLSDLLLMAIPVVGIVFSKTLIGIPIRVTGPIDDPKLGPASPLAIGKGLLGVATNLVKLPLKIVEPIWPEKKTQEQ